MYYILLQIINNMCLENGRLLSCKNVTSEFLVRAWSHNHRESTITSDINLDHETPLHRQLG